MYYYSIVRVNQRVTAMNSPHSSGASPSDGLVSYAGHLLEGLTPLRRYSQFILQPQLSRLLYGLSILIKYY